MNHWNQRTQLLHSTSAVSGLRAVKKIGIFGHVGNKNLGDEAIVAAVIQNIKCRYPDAEIYGFTANPEDTYERHKITAFPIRRIKTPHSIGQYRKSEVDAQNLKSPSQLIATIKTKLKKVPSIYHFLQKIQKCFHLILSFPKELAFLISCFKNLKGIDLLIIAGSQQLIDFIKGSWLFPYTHLKWSIIAKLVKTKVAFVSVGAGPITSPLSKIFIKYALSGASYRSFRDESSKKLIESLGVSGKNFVFPDLAYSLQIGKRMPASTPRRLPPIVGINPVPFSDPDYWPGSSAHAYGIYINKLAEFALWLIQRGYAVLFFPTQISLDPPVINDIRAIMKNRGDIDFERDIVDVSINSFDELISAISMTNIVVASRFHGVIISYILNKPVLGIAYQKKTFDLMKQLNQSDYALDIKSINISLFQKLFITLEYNSNFIKKEIERKIALFQRELETQYDMIFSMLK